MPILWGGATNDLGFIQKIEERLDFLITTTRPNSLSDLRPQLVQIIHDLRKEALISHRDLYGERDIESTPQADVLFVEYTASRGRILRISRDGSDVWLDDFGYGAVGIGDSFVHTLLRCYPIKDLAIDSAKVLAYRIIEDAIAIGAFGMGEPIHIWIIKSKEGQNDLEIRELQKAEMDAIQDTCRIWREAEREIFRQIKI